MRVRWLIVVALLGFAAAVVPALASNQTVTVGGSSAAYFPNEIAVKPGETVTFNHSNGAGLHNVVFDDSSVTPFPGPANASPAMPDNGAWTATATFLNPGTYTFHCGFHGPAMHGTVYVNADGSVPGSGTTISIPTTTTTTPTTSTPTGTTPTTTTPTTPAADRTAPRLTGVAPAARSFCAKAGKRCARAGVTIDFSVDEVGTVVSGTLAKRPLRGTKRRFKSFGTVRFIARIAGDNQLRFAKTAEGRRLSAGSYKLTLVATDASENRSRARTVSFTVR